MKRLPERIWVCVDKEHGNIWSIDEGIEGTEFIRADVAEEAVRMTALVAAGAKRVMKKVKT